MFRALSPQPALISGVHIFFFTAPPLIVRIIHIDIIDTMQRTLCVPFLFHILSTELSGYHKEEPIRATSKTKN